MTDREVLRYVVGHMEQYPDPAIRKALVEKGVPLGLVEQALFEAKRLAKEAKQTGKPIDLGGEEKKGLSWSARITLALAVAGVAIAVARLYSSR